MRCPNCNALVSEGELFCGECGARVTPPAPPTVVTPPAPPPAPALAGTGGASKALLGGGALVAIVVVGVVLVCLCLAVVVVASGVLNPPAPTPTLVPATNTPTPRIPTATPVKPTPTFRPASTPKPPGVETPTVVSGQGFTEDFSTDTGNWDLSTGDRGKSYIQDGELHTEVTQTQSIVWTAYKPGRFQDFTLEVDGRKVSGSDNNDYGVLFRYVDRQNFYRFMVSGTGKYSLDQQLKGQWNTIKAWTTHTAVKKGDATNHLKVIAQGSTIKLYVNDELVDTITDDSIPQAGQVAVNGGSYDEADVHVAFDNVRVTPGVAAFQDDFADNRNEWPEQTGIAFFENGEYHIYDKDAAHAYWNTKAGKFGDATIEAQVRKVEGAEDMAYGVAFRAQDLSNFYNFVVTGDGRYAFGKRKAGQWEFIILPKNSDAVKKGDSTNVLRVVCKGSSFEFYINGQKVDSAQDDFLSEGYVGFHVDQGVHLAVDSVTVWKE
jgi:hypothetical protein